MRECWTSSAPEYLAGIRNLEDWQGLQTVITVRAEREEGDKKSAETRYYISSLDGDARQALRAVRGHWEIENKVHWVLDIAFRKSDTKREWGAELLFSDTLL